MPWFKIRKRKGNENVAHWLRHTWHWLRWGPQKWVAALVLFTPLLVWNFIWHSRKQLGCDVCIFQVVGPPALTGSSPEEPCVLFPTMDSRWRKPHKSGLMTCCVSPADIGIPTAVHVWRNERLKEMPGKHLNNLRNSRCVEADANSCLDNALTYLRIWQKCDHCMLEIWFKSKCKFKCKGKCLCWNPTNFFLQTAKLFSFSVIWT